MSKLFSFKRSVSQLPMAVATLMFACAGLPAVGCGGDDTSGAGASGTTSSTSGTGTGTGGAGGAGGGTSTTGTGTGGTGGGCATADECPGTDTECQTRTCDGGVCGFDNAPAGPVATQVAGDCKVSVCDGNGATALQNDDADVLDDNNGCTVDTCDNGSPVNLPAPAGTACTDGGVLCDGNGSCVECVTGADCMSGVCDQNLCVPPTCADGVVNGNETDKDCGGTDCAPCVDGYTCAIASDCQSGVCVGGSCAAPTCSDVVENGSETDVDCGGGACAPCGPDLGCAVDADCVGGACSGTVCLPTCTDAVTNANETDVDCGGPTCSPCNDGQTCAVGADCVSGVCSNGTCAAAACNDAVKNGLESDVDCGGICPACADGQACNAASDCQSGVCTGGFCAAPACNDAVKNGAETDVDCGGPTCGDCADGQICITAADCQSQVCTNGVCQAAACGDAVVNGADACDDGNASSGDGCSATCTVESGYTCSGSPSSCAPTCGDGIVVGAEQCDDGNAVSGDCCSATCQAEAGCEVEPNNTYATANDFDQIQVGGAVKASIKPIGDKDCFQITNTTPVDIKVETFDGGGVTCAGIDTVVHFFDQGGTDLGSDDDGGISACSLIEAPSDSWARQLAPGTYSACVEEFGNNGLISLYQVKISFTAVCGNGTQEGFEQCDDGNQVGGDGCENNCKFSCGNGVIAGAEACDDGNSAANDGCSATCQVEAGYVCAGAPSVCTAICGDGLTKGPEQCDDANVASGDGCSATCTIEPGFTCSGTPSVCTLPETMCNDGVDNDGDGNADAADADCAVPAYFPACAAGQDLRVFRSLDVPKNIPDSNATGVTSTVTVANGGTVQRLAVVYSITHTWDSDLDLFLTPPGGGPLDICSDNGSSGDNFTNTVLDSTCATSVVSGAAPFAGCYQPETSFASLNGTTVDGVFTLKAVDTAAGDLGTLTSWAVVLCSTP